MLEDDAINAVSAVPSLWRVVLAAPDILRPVAHKVRWIEIGSQYMSGDEKAAMKRLFPEARIVQHYGMTEASRTTFLVVSDHDGHLLDSVGQATGSVGVDVLPDGAITIRGDHVAAGRLQDDGTIVSLVDSEGWLRTSDLGELRDGFLYYRGRSDDQINLAGIKLGAENMESRVADLIPAAAGHFAIIPVADALRGEAIRIVAEPPAAAVLPLLKSAVAMILEEKGVSSAGAVHVASVDRLPRTETNKIRRAELRSEAPVQAEQAGATFTTELSPEQSRVAAVWRKVVGAPDIGPDHSFYDLGGDSLGGMQISLFMEAAGFNRASIRATFEGRSLSEVAALAAEETDEETAASGDTLPDQTQRNWALSITRAVAVISVLVSHWAPGFLNRFGGLGEEAERYLGILYSMGTESFATVFGLGIGMTMLPDYREREVSVRFRLRRALLLVGIGLLLIVATRLTLFVLGGQEIDGFALSNAAYNVLTFYLIMLATAPWWLRHVATWRRRTFGLLLSSLVLLGALLLAREFITQEQQRSLLELPRLMTVAGYSVFYMGAISVFGMAAGYWIAQTAETAHVSKTMTFTGILGAGFCMLVLVQFYGMAALGERGSPALNSIPGLFFYGSLMLLVFGLALRMTMFWQTLGAALKGMLKAAIIVGTLALPIYVLHGLVLPVRDILVLVGLSGALALMLPMSAFLLVMGIAGWHTYRAYFR